MRWHANLDAIPLLQGLRTSGDEGEESSRDTTDFGLNIGTALTGNLLNLIASRGSGQSVALDNDIDLSIVVFVGGRLVLNLGKLDSGTRLLLDLPDRRTAATDDVSASRLGDRDRDGDLKLLDVECHLRSWANSPWYQSD